MKMQVRRPGEEITGASHYLKLNYNHSFTTLRKAYFKSSWKMNADNKLPLWGNRREKQEKKFCSLIFTIPLIS